MKILETIKQPEGRRLGFKEVLPSVSDIAKTVIAFSNDAGDFHWNYSFAFL